MRYRKYLQGIGSIDHLADTILDIYLDFEHLKNIPSKYLAQHYAARSVPVRNAGELGKFFSEANLIYRELLENPQEAGRFFRRDLTIKVESSRSKTENSQDF